jgi:hypothetical protein
MNDLTQWIITGVLVIGAVVYLVFRFTSKKKNPCDGCSGNCGSCKYYK